MFLLLLLVLTGCSDGQKRFTEREVNALAMQSHVRNRGARALQTLSVLEQLRSGATSNAVETLETSLDSDIQELRTVLRQADIPDQYRIQAQTTLSRLEAYRARYPHATGERQ